MTGSNRDHDGDRPDGELRVVEVPSHSPPTRTGEAAPAEERSPTVAGVLLAAGRSNRFEGGNKLLAELDGRPVVAHAAGALLSAGLPTAAVVGHDARRVRDAVRAVDAGGRLAVVASEDDRRRAGSVRAGIRAVWGADAAVVALGDMPRVDPGSVRRLVAAYRTGAGSALAAAHRGRRGNPVLFDARHFPALAALSGDDGGLAVLRDAEDAALVETGDPGVRADVDTPADLQRLR